MCKVTNTSVLEHLHQFVIPSSNSTSITSRPSVTSQGVEKAEPTIKHKYPLLELKASTWPKHLLVTESMQDQEHIDK